MRLSSSSLIVVHDIASIALGKHLTLVPLSLVQIGARDVVVGVHEECFPFELVLLAIDGRLG